MAKHRLRMSRDTWWLVILLALGGGPVVMAAMFSVAVVALAGIRYLPSDGGGAPVKGPAPSPDLTTPPPAPSDPTVARLRLTVEGDGQVYVTPPGGSCGPRETCAFRYRLGDRVTLAAVAGFSPGSNARFVGWYGDCRSLGRELYPSLIMDADKGCLARFTPAY